MFQKIQAIFIKLVRGTEFGIRSRWIWYLHYIGQYSTYLGPYTNKLEFHSIQSSILDDFFSHAAKFSSFIFHLGTNWSQSVIFQTGMKTNSFFTHLQAGLYSNLTTRLYNAKNIHLRHQITGMRKLVFLGVLKLASGKNNAFANFSILKLANTTLK